jgi:hypothetical protein
LVIDAIVPETLSISIPVAVPVQFGFLLIILPIHAAGSSTVAHSLNPYFLARYRISSIIFAGV